jgi:hypothetical protein
MRILRPIFKNLVAVLPVICSMHISANLSSLNRSRVTFHCLVEGSDIFCSAHTHTLQLNAFTSVNIQHQPSVNLNPPAVWGTLKRAAETAGIWHW